MRAVVLWVCVVAAGAALVLAVACTVLLWRNRRLALRIPCPVCPAQVGVWCLDVTRRHRTKGVHEQRIHAAWGEPEEVEL